MIAAVRGIMPLTAAACVRRKEMKKSLSSRMHRRAKRNKTKREELKGRAERILKSAHRQAIVINEPEVWPPADMTIHVDPHVSVYNVPRNGSEERPFRRLKQAINFVRKQGGYFLDVISKKQVSEFEKTGKAKLTLRKIEVKEDQGIYANVGVHPTELVDERA